MKFPSFIFKYFNRRSIPGSLLLLALIFLIGLASELVADDDDDDYRSSRTDFAPVTHELTRQECSDCHFLYSSDMLPARSWKKLMSKKALEDHFEEVIELPEEDRMEIEDYLMKNAADFSKNKEARKFFRSARRSTPIRITEINRFIREHDEVRESDLIRKNGEKFSISQCNECHPGAERGYYDDD